MTRCTLSHKSRKFTLNFLRALVDSQIGSVDLPFGSDWARTTTALIHLMQYMDRKQLLPPPCSS